jgi:methyltransferase (TIGR00027 family)
MPAATWSRAVTLAGLAARVAWMDDRIGTALDDGIGQVAIVGAGFDSRAWRLRREGVRWFELDHAVSQHEKRRVAPGPGPTFVEADLRTEDAVQRLVAGGLDPGRPAVFVFEGVTMYLDEGTLRRQFHRIAEDSPPGSRLLADFTPPPGSGTAQHTRQLWLQRLARGGSGERFRFTASPQDAAALVAGAGWTIDETTSLCDAARAFVPERSRLPVGAVNPDKTLLAAHTGRTQRSVTT